MSGIRRRASKWLDALPIGNGRMGAMIYGGIAHERIQFNEQSLWSGDNNWDGEYETGDHGFGSYRDFGELLISFTGQSANADYTRSLDLFTGIHKTSFTQSGVNYNREAFASHPDQVMVFSFKADKEGALSGEISLKSAQGAKSIATNQSLIFSDVMPNGLKYAAAVTFKHTEGNVKIKRRLPGV
ncbi:glycoside hydrolase family 95 protein [Pedobacter sp. NJ-S-72]